MENTAVIIKEELKMARV